MMMLGLVIGSMIFLFGAIFLQALRKIPADPPHVALVTRMGKRIKKIKREGWRLFFIYPFLYGYIKINVTKVNKDLKLQIVRTPDLVELGIPVSVTWTPAWQFKDEERPDLLIEYLNTGAKEGIETILVDIIRERLREWAISMEEGPEDFKEALGAKEEATAILLKAIIGEEIKPIPSDIPTPILFKYFAKPQQFPTNDRDKKKWGEKWEILEMELTNDLAKYGITKEKLEEAIKERLKEVQKARQGNGYFLKPQLGIILNRLNIGEIMPKGETAKAMEFLAKEKREMLAETFELEHIRDRIKELVELGFSKEQALEIIQTERGKVKKEIKESKWNVSPETREMIEKIGSDLIANILRKWKDD